jgi:hypothetical protein
MKGYIYVIRSHQTDEIYYGSTKEELTHRLSSHKRGYKLYLKTNKNMCSSYNLIKYDDAYIELVEQIEYEKKMELNKKENEYIRQNKCVNKNGKDINKYHNKYYDANREKFLEKNKKDYEKRKLKLLNNDKKEILNIQELKDDYKDLSKYLDY